MIADHMLVSSRWRRQLDGARLLVALSCLAAHRPIPSSGSLLAPILLSAFCLYSAIVLFRRNVRRTGSTLLGLLVDTVFFLICANTGTEAAFWVCVAFYAYLMISAVLIHQWQQVSVVSGISLGFLVLVRPPNTARLWPILLTASLLALLFSLQKRSLLERLFHSTRQAVLFRSESEKAREAERQRIAADFHDGPLQSFISLQMRLEVLRRLLEKGPAQAMDELGQLQEFCRSQVAELRAFVRSMRPIDVDAASLTATISRLAETFQKDTGISLTFLGGGGSLDQQNPEVTMELLQVVREALHNVQKHSGASRVALLVDRGLEGLEISIQDDGSGFAFSGCYTLDELETLHLGPASIKRRVRALGGNLSIDSRPGAGATLKIRIPA